MALAQDREGLEADGWRLIDVKEDVDGTPFSARFRRTAQTEQKRTRTRREDSDESSGAGGKYWIVLGILVAIIAVGVTVTIKVQMAKSDSSQTESTDQTATLGVEGAPGLLFTGTISDGTASRDIKGGAPQSFDLEPHGASYTVLVQKQNTDLSLLKVTVTCVNGTSFSSSTTSPSGVLVLSAHCQ